MRTLLASSLLQLLAVSVCVGAAPVVEFTDVHRVMDDLVMSWAAAPVMVDGYRVYRSEDATCSPDVLVYEGPVTTFTDPGVLASTTPALYRVVTFIAAEESEPSEPAYKYAIALADTGQSGPYIPWPSWDGIADSVALCTLLNGAPLSTSVVTKIVRWDQGVARPIVQSCSGRTVVWQFSGMRPQPLMMKTNNVGSMLVAWGRSQAGWLADLNAVRTAISPCDPVASYCDANLFAVSLPWDHDYTDLASIAADIPSAVDVRLFNRAGTGSDLYVGLTRGSSSDPWTGTNAALAPRTSEGVFIAVDVPTMWYPRRQCLGTRFRGPARIRDLRVTSSAAGTELVWSPDSQAAQGYQIWRLTDKTAIPATLSFPVDLRVPETVPAFPVVDPPPAIPASLEFYQAVGVDSSGEPGRL